MRFLELRPDGVADGFELHPRLTLLSGFSPAQRVALVGFAHSIAEGESFGWSGLVDVHGVVTSLDSMLEIVGETSEAALILDASALADVVGHRQADQSAGSADEDDARRSEIDGLVDELAAANGLRNEMLARLQLAENQSDPDALDKLDVVSGRLARVLRTLNQQDPWGLAEERSERIAALESRVERLDEAIVNLPRGDRGQLAEALAMARAAEVSSESPCPVAARLAEEVDSLRHRLIVEKSRLLASTGGTQPAIERLKSARAEARRTEAAAVPRDVTNEEEQRLEELHDRVVALELRTGRSVRRGAALRDYEAAKAALDEALDEIGYPTWAAFRMGDRKAVVPPEVIEAHEKAKAELEAASHELAETTATIDNDPALSSVVSQLDTARAAGSELLETPLGPNGPTDEGLVQALRVRKAETSSLPTKPNEGTERLRAVAEQCDIPGADGVESNLSLIGLAETWLRVLQAADEALVQLTHLRDRAHGELLSLAAGPDHDRPDQLATERDEVLDAESDVEAHWETLIAIVDVNKELHMLAATELALAEQHDFRLAELERDKQLRDEAEAQISGNQSGLHIDELAARIPRGVGGPLPLVILLGDAPVESLDPIAALPDDVQIIVMGDAVGMASYAERLGGASRRTTDGLPVG